MARQKTEPVKADSIMGRNVFVRHAQFGNGQRKFVGVVLSEPEMLDGIPHIDVMVFEFGMTPRSVGQIPLYADEPKGKLPAAWLVC